MATETSEKGTSRAFLVELRDEVFNVPSTTGVPDPMPPKPKQTSTPKKFPKMESPILEEVTDDDETEESFDSSARPSHHPPCERKPEKKTPDPQPQITCFTCFVGPCPEPINANFQYSEFMICYRDANSRCENNMMRYYCCPLCLVTVEKDGEETYELRAARTEANLHSNSEYNQQRNNNWHQGYYNQHQGMPQGHHQHSFSSHNFNFNHQLPPQFSFLNYCRCACPPQMMASFLNHRCPQGFVPPPPPPPQAHPVFCQFSYQPNYMYPHNGSAMG